MNGITRRILLYYSETHYKPEVLNSNIDALSRIYIYTILELKVKEIRKAINN